MTAIAPAFAAAFAASAAATRALAAFAAVALDASAAADSSTDNLRRGNFLPVLISLRRVNFSAIMSAMPSQQPRSCCHPETTQSANAAHKRHVPRHSPTMSTMSTVAGGVV